MKDKHPETLVSTVMRDPVHWFAFGFGSGLLPVAPGTWGSLFTALGFWFFAPVDTLMLLGISAVLFIAGIWICDESSKRLGVHDHGGIVWDEVVGMLLTLSVARPEPQWFAVAFLAFRVFDVWKPWPIRDVDHSLHGGLGIMLDDVLAAAYAALVTFILQVLIAGT